MVLMSAVYFKGDWLYKFDKSQSNELLFNVNFDSNKLVPVMFLEAELFHGYLPEEDAEFVVLPYSVINSLPFKLFNVSKC